MPFVPLCCVAILSLAHADAVGSQTPGPRIKDRCVLFCQYIRPDALFILQTYNYVFWCDSSEGKINNK